MVSHPKIETLWVPKGQQRQQNHGPQPTAATKERLHLPLLRNLLSALNFEHHDNTTAEVPVGSPPIPSPPQQQQQLQRGTTTTTKDIVSTTGSTRFFQSSSKVLRGSIIESNLNGKSGDGSDIFYDALEYGNAPNSKDDFLPDSESPRESVVLAGVIVTSAIQSPNRIDHGGGRHQNIETVLQSKNDLRNDSSDHHQLYKSVEYTEHEYVHRLTINAINGGGPDAVELTQQSTNSNISSNDYRISSVVMQYPPAPPPAPDELPLRFLRAGKNDPVEGVRRYQATLQMRSEQKIDTILRESSEKFHIIKKYYPHYCHFRGKNNEPCFYEQPPKTNLRELRNNGVTLDKLLRHYTMVTEYQWQYIERDDLARSIYIIDLNGIRMTDFVGEAVDFVKKASVFSSQHYPERAGYVFVINVPGWFKLIWNVVKPIIDEDTLKKIYILRGKDEIRSAMQERIPLEHIPPEYGGTSVPLGQSPQEETLSEWIEHNNILAAQQRTVCHDSINCKFCTWVPARSY